ncbi:uncharacterized protein [Scyliorhinus torazame]|uniref:uncharacterized protein n=1 Tax=Scyliorhinus torazame TaxID=75743 RepID=UPI003B5AABB2
MADPNQSVDSEPLADRKLLPTTSKGGAGIPDVSVEDMLGDFRSFIRRQFGLSEVATKIESKYDIPKGQWSLDNIKKAWGKTTRLNGGRRMKWSFAVMAQLQKHQETIAKIKFDHEYRSTKDQLIAVVEELRDAKSKLEHYDEIRTDLQNKTSELQQLSVQIGEFQNQVFKVESKYQQLQLNTERSDDEYRSTKKQLIAVVEELQDAKSKLEYYDEIKTDLQVAKSKLEHYDEIKTELRDAKSKLETDLQNKTSELQQLSFQITEFQNQVVKVETKYRQLQLKTEQIELENCKLIEERCVLAEHCKISVQKFEQTARTQKAAQAPHLVAQSAIAQPRTNVTNKSVPLSDESDEDSVQIQPMLPAAPAAAVAAPAGISAVTTISPPALEQTCTLAPLKSRKEIPQCFFCGRVGHWMAKCYQKQRMDSRDDNEVDNVHYNTFPPHGQPCNTYQQDTPSLASGQQHWLSNYNHGLLLQLINNSIIIAQLFTRGLCVDALIELSDENADWKLSFNEFLNCLNPGFVPPEKKCALEDETYEDGAETTVECNRCVCACGNWVCTAMTCDGKNKDLPEQQPQTTADDEMTEEDWTKYVHELNKHQETAEKAKKVNVKDI